MSEKLARQAVARAGGRVEKDARGEETFVIPVQTPKPGASEQSYEPGLAANVRFTPEEMSKIKAGNSPAHMRAALSKIAPGWDIANCGTAMNPGLRADWGGKQNVLVTHPLDRKTGCVLKSGFTLPADKKSVLRVVVGHDPRGDFDIIVRANGQQLLRKSVSKATATADPWLTEEVDLSSFAGKKLKLELVNEPRGWKFERAYWAEIAIVSK